MKGLTSERVAEIYKQVNPNKDWTDAEIEAWQRSALTQPSLLRQYITPHRYGGVGYTKQMLV